MDMQHILMACGHTANSLIVTPRGDVPACVICDCKEQAPSQLIVASRKAQCIYCHLLVDSEPGLPLFCYMPLRKYDSYYCGCEGWD